MPPNDPHRWIKWCASPWEFNLSTVLWLLWLHGVVRAGKRPSVLRPVWTAFTFLLKSRLNSFRLFLCSFQNLDWSFIYLSLKVATSFTTISWWSGEGNGNPLQYSCWENPTDRGAWWAIVHGVTKTRTLLKQLSTWWSSYQLLCS